MSEEREKEDVLELTEAMATVTDSPSVPSNASPDLSVTSAPIMSVGGNPPDHGQASEPASAEREEEHEDVLELGQQFMVGEGDENGATSESLPSLDERAVEVSEDVPLARISVVPALSQESEEEGSSQEEDEPFELKPDHVVSVQSEPEPSEDGVDHGQSPAVISSNEDLSEEESDGEPFELSNAHMVDSASEDKQAPTDAEPVDHAFDFGTPEMVFDSFNQEEAGEADSGEEEDIEELGDEELEEDELDDDYRERETAPPMPPPVRPRATLVGDSQESEDERAEENGPRGTAPPRPIESYFKNDRIATEAASQKLRARTRRRRGAPQEWWASIFDDEYLMLLPPQSPYEHQKQIEFIQSNLGLPPGALLLDLACGAGRNSIGMAKRNYRIVGVDLSLSMLARAGEAAQDAGQKINFIHGDMRDLGFDKTFDGVYCLDTSFGFFDEPTNAKVLHGVYRALKPGGSFLLEIANRDFVVKQQPNLIWFQMDNMVCMEETDFNYINSRLYITRQLIIGDNERQSRHEFSLRLYSLHEIGQLLHQAGFAVTKVSGHRATPGAFFGPESSKLIIVAERRGD